MVETTDSTLDYDVIAPLLTNTGRILRTISGFIIPRLGTFGAAHVLFT